METLRARLVLEDAYEAARRLSERLDKGEPWQIEWVATVALLRAVGHVLHKVDARRSADSREAVAAAYARWKTEPEHAIFRDFIENERNNVLKRYRLGEHAPAYLLQEDGSRILLEDGSDALLLETPDFGPVQAALRWWDEQLAALTDTLTDA